MSDETLEVKIVEDKGSVNKLVASVDKLADSAEKAGKATEKSTDATKKQGDAAEKAASDNTKLDKALGGIAATGNLLKSALGGAIAALSFEKLIGYADAYSGISNKLRLVTTDQSKLNGIIEASYKIAQDTSTSFKQVADVYGKVDAAVKGYNGNAKDVPTITKAIAQAVALTGPSSEEAANGLRQFGQTMDIGKLQAEEFNAILEGTPGLAKALEGGIRKSGVQITGSLKQMAADGKISTQMLLEGLKEIAPELDVLSKGAIPTVAQAMQRLENAFIKYVGQANGAISGTTLIAKAIGVLSDNLNIVVPVLGAFVALLALGSIAGAINSILALTGGVGAFSAATAVATTTTRTLTVAMLTNPLFLAATVATLGFLAVGLYKTGGSFGELATRVKDSGAAILAFLAPIGAAIVKAGEWSLKVLDAAAKGLGLSNAVKAASAAFVALVPGIGAAATAQASGTVSALSYLDAQTKVGVSLKAIRDAAATVPPAVSAVAPALSSVGTAATTSATSLRANADGVIAVRNGFGSIPTAAASAASGFTQVSGAATGALPGFATVTKAANDTGAGFLVVSMNANRVPVAVQAAATASASAAPAIASVGTAAGTTATNVAKVGEVTVTTGLQLNTLVASTDPCTVSLTNLGKSTDGVVPPMDRLAESAEDARKAIADKDAAVQAAAKGADDYAKRLEKLSGAYNQLGEKLETAEQAQARYKKAQDDSNAAIQKSLDNLKQYYRDADTATTSTKNLGSAAQSTSGDFTALGQTFSSATAAMDALNRAVGNYAGMSKQARDAMYEEVEAYNAARNARNSYSASGGGSNQRGPNGDTSYYSDSNIAQREAERGGVNDQAGSDSYSVSAGGNSVTGDKFNFGGIEVGRNGTNVGNNPWNNVGILQWRQFLATNADVFATSGRWFRPQEVGKIFMEVSSYGRAADRGASTRIDPFEWDKRIGVPFAERRKSEKSYGSAVGFQHGGSFMVGGSGGTDSQRVQFNASPNERVTIETPSQRMNNDRRNEDSPATARQMVRPINNVFNIKTTDEDSFKRSRKQVGQDIVRRIQRSIG